MLACAMVFVACEPQIHRNDQDKLGIDQQNNGDVCNKIVISQTKWQCKQHHLGSSNRTPSGMEQTKFGNSLQTMGASWTNMVILAATIEEKLIIQKWRPSIFGMIRIRFSSTFSWDISQPPIFVVGLVFLTWTVLATRFYRSGGNQISSNGSPQGLHRFPWESIGLLGFNFWDTTKMVGRVSIILVDLNWFIDKPNGKPMLCVVLNRNAYIQ